MILEADLWATARQNLYLGPVSNQVMLKAAYSGSEISWNLEISLVASLAIILFGQRITRALISLLGCEGWSAPLLFTNPRNSKTFFKISFPPPPMCQQKPLHVYVLPYFTHCMEVACWHTGERCSGAPKPRA